MIGLRLENAEGCLPIFGPIALDLMAVLVQPPTAIAIAQVVGIVVLEGKIWHGGFLW